MRLTVKLAFRRISTSVGVSIFTVLALAASLGAVGAAGSLWHVIVHRELAVREPQSVVLFAPMMGEAILGISGNTLSRLITSQTTLADLCGFSRGAMAVEIGNSIIRKGSEAVSGRCYALLGVRPFLGRLIEESDAPLSGTSRSVVVLSHQFWRTSLGADTAIVGRTLKVESRELEVIGVLPRSFAGLHVDQGPDLVVPLGLVNPLVGGAPGVSALYGVARLANGTTLSEARAELRAAWPSVWASTNPPGPAGAKPPAASDPSMLQVESAARGISDLRKQYTLAIYVFLALALMLVAMAAVNVSGMWISRAADRAIEVKTLAAIGASEFQVVSPLIAESLMIGLSAGLLAVVFAWALTVLIAQTLWIGFLPLTMRVTPQPLLLVAIVLASSALAVALAVPAILLALRQARTALDDDARASIPQGMWRRVTLVVQCALTLVLMFGAALLTRNLWQLQSINPGYQTAPLSWARLERLPARGGAWDRRSYALELQESIAKVRGVQSAALSNAFPTTELRHLSSLTPVSRSGSDASIGVREYRISPAFFETIGVQLIAGRDFRRDDDADHPRVAIINTTLASHLFPQQDAVGQFITVVPLKRTATVVGVVADFSPGDIRITRLPSVFSPYLQDLQLLTTPLLVVRAEQGIAVDALREAVAAPKRHYLGAFRTVDEHLSTLIARERMLFKLSAFFAALGLIVGGAGIFAALAYSVSRRTRELAVRSAIGAPRHRIVWTIVGEVLAAVAVGTLVGLPPAIAGGGVVRGLLYGASVNQVGILILCVAALGITAILAAVGPSVRAIRIDPAIALRES